MKRVLTLKNGLRIICEQIPHFRSVSVGLTVAAGSACEEKSDHGISHFIEHMLFKGTEKYSAKELAEVIDAVGGVTNAATSRETTCFYGKVVDEHLRLLLDVLSQMVLHPLLNDEDIEREKGVVLEEIAMSEDSPEDVVNDLSLIAHLGEQSFSRSILGTRESVLSFGREDIVRYMARFYRPENSVLAVVGNFDAETLVSYAEELFGAWQGGCFIPFSRVLLPHEPGHVARNKDIEQVHLQFGWTSGKSDPERHFPLTLFNAVYGGAASSRLFQSIREEKGLAYSVCSFPMTYTAAGVFCVYAGISPQNVAQVVELIDRESEKLLRDGLTEREFKQGREQLKGYYILSLESTSNRMHAMSDRLLLHNSIQEDSEAIDRINDMTYDDVMDVARFILTQKRSCALVGRDVEGMTI